MELRYGMSALALSACLAGSVVEGRAQTIDFFSANAGGGPVVRNAPYSGEGVTTVRQMLYDGTKIERTITATVHRDSAGRVRREQAIFGLAAVDPASDSAQVVTIVDPVNSVIWTLQSADRTARALRIRGGSGRTRSFVPPPPPPPAPLPAPGQGSGRPGAGVPPLPPPPPPRADSTRVVSLGTKTIEGLEATGSKSTLSFPTGSQGNDRPIEVTEERWESTELRILLYSRRHDPRTGDIEYRLSKISREEPSADLFAVPADYRVVEPPAPPPPPPPPPGM